MKLKDFYSIDNNLHCCQMGPFYTFPPIIVLDFLVCGRYNKSIPDGFRRLVVLRWDTL